MGGKKSQSEGLGRALIRQHNVMVQQSKDKGRDFRLQQRRSFLESVTEISDIDTVLQHADEAADSYSLDNPLPDLFLNLDVSSEANEMMTPKERREQQKREEALHASSLRVPRRPTWNAKMSFEELDANEKQSFLVWRRSLARLEENENLILTPFEKNLDIWRQLWRVLERSDLLVMVVDARDPLFYRCPDLEAYALETDEHKKTMLLVNKADLLPLTVREKWATYFRTHGILFVFWSAKAASAAMEGKKLVAKESVPSDSDSKIYDRDELLSRLQAEAEAIASLRESHGSNETDDGNSSPDLSKSRQRSKNVVVGFVGYPNVGKSSTINALVGEKRTGVTSTPGKTKHFQTLIISEDLVLCDCPGLVFPSFSSSRHEMVASGVLPIDRLVEHREALQVVANRVPRNVIEGVYNIALPKPKPYEPQSRPPWASELLRAYCSSRGHVSSSGLPDETRGTRQILKDFIDGKLPHFELPPGLAVDTKNGVRDGRDDFDDSCDSDDGKPNLQHVLEDLESFELGNAQSSKSSAAKKMSAVTSSYKHHKKPQKKKDRSWRVGNDGGDGMPVVRVFQKPAVNFGVIKATS